MMRTICRKRKPIAESTNKQKMRKSTHKTYKRILTETKKKPKRRVSRFAMKDEEGASCWCLSPACSANSEAEKGWGRNDVRKLALCVELWDQYFGTLSKYKIKPNKTISVLTINLPPDRSIVLFLLTASPSLVIKPNKVRSRLRILGSNETARLVSLY